MRLVRCAVLAHAVLCCRPCSTHTRLQCTACCTEVRVLYPKRLLAQTHRQPRECRVVPSFHNKRREGGGGGKYSDSHHDASSFAFASAAFFASATLCRRVSAITALGFFPASFCSSDCSFRFPMLIGEKGQFNLSEHSLHLYNQHNCKPCSFTLVDHLWT